MDDFLDDDPQCKMNSAEIMTFAVGFFLNLVIFIIPFALNQII